MFIISTIIGSFNGIGPLGNTAVSPSLTFTRLISNIIGILTVCAGIWFMFQMVLGAFNWLGSGSDKQSLDNAKKRLTNALVGMAVVVSAYTIIGIVGLFLGFPDIFGLQAVILQLAP